MLPQVHCKHCCERTPTRGASRTVIAKVETGLVFGGEERRRQKNKHPEINSKISFSIFYFSSFRAVYLLVLFELLDCFNDETSMRRASRR